RPPNEDPPIETPPARPAGAVDAQAPDAIKSVAMIQVGAEGMRIDRELYPKPHQQFEYVVQHSEEIKRVQETEGVEAVEEFVKAEVLNKPTEYWTAEKIRESYEREHRVDRRLSLSEMIWKALGLTNRFKTRDERLEEEYQKFIDIERPELASPEAIRTAKAF